MEFVRVGLIFSVMAFLVGLVGLMVIHHSRKPQTAIELAYQAERKQDAARRKEIKKVAKKLRRDIENHLARFGLNHVKRTEGAVKYIDKPGIRTVLYSDDAIYFRIDKLPWQVTFTDLLADHVPTNLQMAIGREVKIYDSTSLGVWVIVYLRSGVAGIPKIFEWKSDKTERNAMNMLPASKPFNVAVGMGENRKFYHADFRDMPHLLIAGSTGGGKSTWVNQALCTLLTRLTPRSFELHLVDLKGGLEFTDYVEAPHVKQVIEHEDHVLELLKGMYREYERRLALLKGAEVRHLAAYNKVRQSLPYVLVVFDELASLQSLRGNEKERTFHYLTQLIQKSRATGIHIWLATQFPSKEFVPSAINANIQAKAVFATNQTGSNMLVGDWAASRIPLGGRLMYVSSGNEVVEVQGPLIEDEQISEAVASLQDAPEPELTAEDLFKLALKDLGGHFNKTLINQVTQGRVSEYRVTKIAKAYRFKPEKNGPIIDLNGDGRFILDVVKERGTKVRKLLPVPGREPVEVPEVIEPEDESAELELRDTGEPVV